MRQIAFIFLITSAYILLVLSPPASGQDQKKKEWTGKLGDGSIITKEDLSKILEEHRKWLESDDNKGQMANLSKADLTGADLSGASLWGAQLEGANLQEADLRGADLGVATLGRALKISILMIMVIWCSLC